MDTEKTLNAILSKLVNIEEQLEANIKSNNEKIMKLRQHIDKQFETIDNVLKIVNKKTDMTINKVGELESRNAILEQKVIDLESKNFREQVLSDLYSKRFNLIVFGIPECEKWEPRTKSLQ